MKRRRTRGGISAKGFSRKLQSINPTLADYLQSLSSGGGSGVLLEDLTCTFEGGVGGFEEGEFFPAGTSLEEVIRKIVTGIPTVSISGITARNTVDGVYIHTIGGEQYVYEAGTELTIDEVGYGVTDPGDLLQDDATVRIDSTSYSTTAPTDSASNVTHVLDSAFVVGASTSADKPFDFTSHNGGYTTTVNISATDINNNPVSNTRSLMHGLPAYYIVLNAGYSVTDLFNGLATDRAAAELIAPGDPDGQIPLLMNSLLTMVQSVTKQAELQPNSDFSGYTWNTPTGTGAFESVFFVPTRPATLLGSNGPSITDVAAGTPTQDAATAWADSKYIEMPLYIGGGVAPNTFFSNPDPGSISTLYTAYQYVNAGAIGSTSGIQLTF